MNQLSKLLRRVGIKARFGQQKKEIVDVYYFLKVKNLSEGNLQRKVPSY